MRTHILLGTLALTLASSTAMAGQVPVVFSGQVAFNTLSGPFGGIAPGTSVMLSFEVITPGSVITPNQFESYSIDLTTFVLDVGGVVAGASSAMGGPALGVMDDYPVADGLFQFQHPLTFSGHAYECELHDSTGTAFSSIDIDLIAGTYPASQWDSVDWSVFGPGGQMGFSLSSVTIHPDASGAIGTGHCASNPNSSGLPAVVSASGCTSVAINDLTLRADQLPLNKSILFFYGPSATQVPFGPGYLCVTGGIFRLSPGNTGPAGSYTHAFDLDAPPANSGPGAILPGSTWHFQSWFRDVGGSTNTSDALSLLFTL